MSDLMLTLHRDWYTWVREVLVKLNARRANDLRLSVRGGKLLGRLAFNSTGRTAALMMMNLLEVVPQSMLPTKDSMV